MSTRDRIEELGAPVRKDRAPDPLDELRKDFNPDQPRGPDGRWVRVFAHGILVNESTMHSFAPNARVVDPNAELHGWRAVPRQSPADVEQYPGQKVKGVLWDVPASEMPELDRLEGVDVGMYEKLELPIRSGDGESKATVYSMPEERRYSLYIGDVRYKSGLTARQVDALARTAREHPRVRNAEPQPRIEVRQEYEGHAPWSEEAAGMRDSVRYIEHEGDVESRTTRYGAPDTEGMSPATRRLHDLESEDQTAERTLQWSVEKDQAGKFLVAGPYKIYPGSLKRRGKVYRVYRSGVPIDSRSYRNVKAAKAAAERHVAENAMGKAKGYNPKQPRIPKGLPGGGRWRGLYFAYGANMGSGGMTVRAPGAKKVSTATLKDHRLTIRGGVMNIEPEKGSEVQGALWELGRKDIRNLDRYEGYPYVYDRDEHVVHTPEGPAKAIAYRMVSEKDFLHPRGDPQRLPNEDYIRTVQEGHEEWGLPLGQLSTAIDDAITRSREAREAGKVPIGLRYAHRPVHQLPRTRGADRYRTPSGRTGPIIPKITSGMSPATRRLEELEARGQERRRKQEALGIGRSRTEEKKIRHDRAKLKADERYMVKINGQLLDKNLTQKEADSIVQQARKKKGPDGKPVRIDVLVDDGGRHVLPADEGPKIQMQGGSAADKKAALQTMADIPSTERHLLAEAGVNVFLAPRRSAKRPARYDPGTQTLYLRRGHEDHPEKVREATKKAVLHSLSVFEDQRGLVRKTAGRSLVNSGAPIVPKEQSDPVADTPIRKDDRNGRILRVADHIAQSARDRLGSI